VKNTLLLILFLLLILAAVFLSLFILRSLVFLVLHYNTTEGIRFSLIRIHALTLLQDIFPFAVITSIIVIFLRMYSKPGILWLSYLLILLITGTVWMSGFTMLARRGPVYINQSQTQLLFSGYIHDTATERIYIHETENNTVYAAVRSSIQDPAGEPHLRYSKRLDSFSTVPENPTFSPIIRVSPMFTAILEEFSLFAEELNRLFTEKKETFYAFSVLILSYFVFSGIILRISKFPLFAVVFVLGIVRLFFFLFSLFAAGTAGHFFELLIPVNVYPPLAGIGYFAVLFFLISLRWGRT